jgi:hypothetical protein
MAKHMIPFATTQEGDKELIELAFSKKKADERKEWLRQFKVNGHQKKSAYTYLCLPAWDVSRPQHGRDSLLRFY